MTSSASFTSLNFDFGVARVLAPQDPQETAMPTHSGRLPPANAIAGPALNSIMAARTIDALVSKQIASTFANTPVLQPLVFMAEIDLAHAAVGAALSPRGDGLNKDRRAKLKRMHEQLCDHKDLYNQLRGNIAKFLAG